MRKRQLLFYLILAAIMLCSTLAYADVFYFAAETIVPPTNTVGGQSGYYMTTFKTNDMGNLTIQGVRTGRIGYTSCRIYNAADAQLAETSAPEAVGAYYQGNISTPLQLAALTVYKVGCGGASMTIDWSTFTPISRFEINWTAGADDRYYSVAAIVFIGSTVASGGNLINLTAPKPTAGQNLNISSININVTSNATYPINCSLYKNNTLNTTTVFSAGNNILVNWTKSFTDGSYTYQINCTQGNDTRQNESTAVIAFNVDTTPPAVTANYTNYYTILQPLSINSYDVHNANLTATDGCNLSYYNSTQTTANYTRTANYDLTNCSLGSHQANLTGCDSFGNCYSTTYTFSSMGQLNVTAYSGITNLSISNFTISIGGVEMSNVTTGIYTLSNLTAGVLNVSLDAFGYAIISQNATINSTLNRANISLYTTNSLYIRIYQEETGLIILHNVSLRFVTTGVDDTYSTLNGTFYIDNLKVTNYTITFSNANFTTRNYQVTIGNRTFQQLNAYLPASTSSTTIFTIYDKDTLETLNETLINQYVFTAGAWVVVDTRLSDITGRAQFSYSTNTRYKFFLSRVDYEDYVFYLNPILFGTYDVKMTKTTQRNTSQDFEDIGIIYAPQIFQNNANTTFNFIIAMPTGGLVTYGMNLSYPGGSNTTSGSNAIGGQMTVTAHILNAGTYDMVTLKYFYHTTVSGYRIFTVTFPIVMNISTADNSLARTGDNTYGLSIWERALIATFILLLVVGIAALAGQPLPGILAGLLVMAFFAYVGFLPLWLVLPSIFVIVFMIIWKSGGA